MIKGSCLCQAVQYACTETGPAFNCHCSQCRKWHGAAFASAMRVPLSCLRIVSGAQFITRHVSSPGVERCFCKVCGSSLFTQRLDLAIANIRLGSVDGDPGVRPSLHVFTGSKAPWFQITDELPQHEARPVQLRGVAGKHRFKKRWN